MKKTALSLLLCVVMLLSSSLGIFASGDEGNGISGGNSEAENGAITTVAPDISAKSAVLIEAKTGTVLYSKQPNIALPPASVTKIMTLLLVAEALDSERIKLTDEVVISEKASSMGGSQIFLKEGESFTVEELIKSTVIASANDAAVALAEYVAGSESAFVAEMNKRAGELMMKSTCFENVTGLDDTVTNHLTSAYDISLMSRELIKHSEIMQYASVWQDSVRNGEFTLTNTNRLVRYYKGCTGLKTGSTDKAGFCVSATAERDGMHLIAVIMGAPTSNDRNNAARALLDYGFSGYALLDEGGSSLEKVPVRFGKLRHVNVYSTPITKVVDKGSLSKIEKSFEIPEYIIAPIKQGDKIGQITYTVGDEEIAVSDIVVREDIEALDFFDILLVILKSIISA